MMDTRAISSIGDALYEKYGTNAIKQAIELNNELDVICYLFETKDCVIFRASQGATWSYFYQDEEDTLQGWSLALLAAEYGRLDVIKWLADIGYDLEINYVINGKTDLLSEAIKNKQFEIVKWLVEHPKTSFDWNRVIKLLDWLESSRSTGPGCMLDFLKQFFNELSLAPAFECLLFRAQEMSTGPQIAYPDAVYQAQFKQSFIEILQKKLTEYFPERNKNKYFLLLKTLSNVDAKFAFDFHLKLLMENHDFLAVSNFCYDSMQQEAIATLARITMAELLISDQFALDEKGSPLDLLPLAETRLKRALQAFYLLKDCQSHDAVALKIRLHDMLSNVTLSRHAASANNWSPLAMHYYPLYLCYKANPDDNNLKAIIANYKQNNFHGIADPKEQPHALEKKKYLQTTIDRFFLPKKEDLMEIDKLDQTEKKMDIGLR